MRPTASLDRRTRSILALLIVVLAALSIHRLCYAPHPGPTVEFSGSTMGTTYMVKVVSENLDAAAQRETAAAIQAQLDRVNALMSNWDPASELSRFSAHHATTPFPVSPETLEVFSVAQEVHRLSDGAFDVTVAPLVRAWGFGEGASETPPDPATVEALLDRVGQAQLEIDPAGSLRKTRRDLEFDLSAVAKGYAVDRVAGALVERGLEDYLVEVGGELRAGGMRADGTPWRVAIERPRSDRREIHQIIALVNTSLATSGDYRNYYERDGVRFSHTIDPRTGRPIRHRLASVSVLHPRAAHADALATALNVLGPESGYALAERMGLPALFILRSDEPNRFESKATPAFEAQVETLTPNPEP